MAFDATTIRMGLAAGTVLATAGITAFAVSVGLPAGMARAGVGAAVVAACMWIALNAATMRRDRWSGGEAILEPWGAGLAMAGLMLALARFDAPDVSLPVSFPVLPGLADNSAPMIAGLGASLFLTSLFVIIPALASQARLRAFRGGALAAAATVAATLCLCVGVLEMVASSIGGLSGSLSRGTAVWVAAAAIVAVVLVSGLAGGTAVLGAGTVLAVAASLIAMSGAMSGAILQGAFGSFPNIGANMALAGIALAALPAVWAWARAMPADAGALVMPADAHAGGAKLARAAGLRVVILLALVMLADLGPHRILAPGAVPPLQNAVDILAQTLSHAAMALLGIGTCAALAAVACAHGSDAVQHLGRSADVTSVRLARARLFAVLIVGGAAAFLSQGWGQSPRVFTAGLVLTIATGLPLLVIAGWRRTAPGADVAALLGALLALAAIIVVMGGWPVLDHALVSLGIALGAALAGIAAGAIIVASSGRAPDAVSAPESAP